MEGGLSLNSGDRFGTPGGRSFGLSERTPGARQVLSGLPAWKPGKSLPQRQALETISRGWQGKLPRSVVMPCSSLSNALASGVQGESETPEQLVSAEVQNVLEALSRCGKKTTVEEVEFRIASGWRKTKRKKTKKQEIHITRSRHPGAC